MADHRNIVLIGFMATGKTSTGRDLAAKLGRRFIDMDQVIEEREGRSIPAIFATDGEPRFRELERNLVRELSGQSDLVIAPGGGIVLNPDNIRDFSRTGIVIGLRARPETVLARVGNDTTRPLLQVPDRLGKIRELLARREPLYAAIPTSLDTDGQTPEQIADRILALLESRPPGSP